MKRRLERKRQCVVGVLLAVLVVGCVPAGSGEEESTELPASVETTSERSQALASEEARPTESEVGCAVPDAPLLTLDVDLGAEQEQAVDGGGVLVLRLNHLAEGSGTARIFARVMTETEWKDFEVGQVDIGGVGESTFKVNVARLALPTDTGAMAGELGFYVRYSGEDGGASTPRHTLSFHHDGRTWRIYGDAVRKDRYQHGALSEEAQRAVQSTDTQSVQWMEDEQGNTIALSPPSFATAHVTTSPLQ